MIAIYCRISKHKAEGKDVSIETQLEKGVAFAKSEGHEYKSFIDRAISGTKDEIKDRPEFALMLDHINKGSFQSILFLISPGLSEITGSRFVYLHYAEQMKYYPGGNYLDPDVAENSCYTGILSLTNEFFATLTGQKVKLAHYKNSLKGKSHGITAYGYVRDKNGLLEIQEDQAKVVRRIFKMSGEGIGVYTIAKTLNQDGIPTKFNDYSGEFKRRDKYTNQYTYFQKGDVRWRGNVVHLLLTNQIYKGIRKWNNGENETKVPPIIDEATWDRWGKNLGVNKRMQGKGMSTIIY
ncbi:MAG: recombinase family protein [Bacteroidales bacterium]|nr:recombinase family protein [Bacteroidales bacterium]